MLAVRVACAIAGAALGPVLMRRCRRPSPALAVLARRADDAALPFLLAGVCLALRLYSPGCFSLVLLAALAGTVLAWMLRPSFGAGALLPAQPGRFFRLGLPVALALIVAQLEGSLPILARISPPGMCWALPADRLTQALEAWVRPLPSERADDRRKLVYAIGWLGGPGWPALRQAALHDPAPAVRTAGTQALADQGGLDAVPVLLVALHDPDPEVRMTATAGLGDLGIRAAPLSKEQRRQVAAALAAAALDRHPGVRAAASFALGELR